MTGPLDADTHDEQKHEAALKGVEYVQDGMVVGLGTGSTARHAVLALGERVKQGLRIVGVPTSEKTADLARKLGIPLATLEEQPRLDVVIDGADEVDLRAFNVIKGGGGALLREKIVALSSREVIYAVDESKVVGRLGVHFPLPVEVVQFGWRRTASQLEALGCEPHRREKDGKAYLTDAGNFILDCHFGGIEDAKATAARIKAITGVVEHGLFVGIVTRIVIARPGGIQVVERNREG